MRHATPHFPKIGNRIQEALSQIKPVGFCHA
jgi:hypothetical protein